MKKQALSAVTLAAALVSVTAAVGSPAARVSTYFYDSAADSPETFEYELHPFSRGNFDSREIFEEWMDELGARGLGSVMHLPNNLLDPGDDTRVFMRGVGGSPVRVFDYAIERYRIDPEATSDTWVAEWDRLGAMGKILVFLFQEGGQWYVVTEAALMDGELQTWSWARRQAGTDSTPSVAAWKRAAKWLARRGYIPRTIGFSADRSKFYVVGIKNTTAEREAKVKLRFRKITLTTPAAKWKGHVNKQGKKGYLLVAVELAERMPMDFLMVFAQEKVDGKTMKRRRCLLEPVLVDDQPRMISNLNDRGATGQEVIFVTNVGGFNSPTLFLCDPDQEPTG